MKVKVIKTDLLKNTSDPHFKYYKLILFKQRERYFVQALSGRFGNAAKISFLDEFEKLEEAERYYFNAFERKIKSRGYTTSKNKSA